MLNEEGKKKQEGLSGIQPTCCSTEKKRLILQIRDDGLPDASQPKVAHQIYFLLSNSLNISSRRFKYLCLILLNIHTNSGRLFYEQATNKAE